MTPAPTTPEPTESSGADSLPRCRYRDEVTRFANPDDWRTTLLDTTYRLPADYLPTELVSTAQAGLGRGYEIRPEVVADLRAMANAAESDGVPIAVRWAFRTYAEQQGAFAYWVDRVGYDRALEVSARPGHSEHFLATAIDFRSAGSLRPPWDYDDWGATAAGRWMASNSWRFGFILSYPQGASVETCYGYEPWHFRYLGRDMAASVHESGSTLRRYLWEHFHTDAAGV